MIAWLPLAALLSSLVATTLLLSQRPVIKSHDGPVTMSERILSTGHIIEPYVESEVPVVAGDTLRSCVHRCVVGGRWGVSQAAGRHVLRCSRFGRFLRGTAILSSRPTACDYAFWQRAYRILLRKSQFSWQFFGLCLAFGLNGLCLRGIV